MDEPKEEIQHIRHIVKNSQKVTTENSNFKRVAEAFKVGNKVWIKNLVISDAYKNTARCYSSQKSN